MILYSTNPLLKYHIQRMYYDDIHYVWCSEAFDSTKSSAYAPVFAVAPSSNPCDIYQQLKKDVSRSDLHSDKINAQRSSMKALAINFYATGRITEDVKDEIVYQADNATISNWRPLIYLIPRSIVISRIKPVPAPKRAGLGMEYIIEDLKGGEFDIIEP